MRDNLVAPFVQVIVIHTANNELPIGDDVAPEHLTPLWAVRATTTTIIIAQYQYLY